MSASRTRQCPADEAIEGKKQQGRRERKGENSGNAYRPGEKSAGQLQKDELIQVNFGGIFPQYPQTGVVRRQIGQKIGQKDQARKAHEVAQNHHTDHAVCPKRQAGQTGTGQQECRNLSRDGFQKPGDCVKVFVEQKAGGKSERTGIVSLGKADKIADDNSDRSDCGDDCDPMFGQIAIDPVEKRIKKQQFPDVPVGGGEEAGWNAAEIHRPPG